MKVIYNGCFETYMAGISERDVWYVCGWLREFMRDTEDSGRELSIASLTEKLRRIVGSLSTRNGNQQDIHVRDLMIVEIDRMLSQSGPPGPKDFEIVYPPPGASECSMYRAMLLSRLCSFIE